MLHDNINSTANYLGVSEQDVMASIGMIKAEHDKAAGVIVPLRGLLEDQLSHYSDRGIKQGMFYIEDNVLREIERKTAIISIIVNNRIKAVRRFSRISHDNDIPGFRIKMKQEKKNPTKQEQEEMEQLEQFFANAGRTDYDGWEEREDTLMDVWSMMVREYYTIDKACIELRRDKKGRPVDFWMLDGATIKRVYQTGYKGQKSDFDPRSYIASDGLDKRIYEAKLELIPEDLSKVAFVQEIDGRLTAAFTRKDLIYDYTNKRVDIRYRGFGYSHTEQAMNVITAFLLAMAYNTDAFDLSSIPKIALAFKAGGFSGEQLKQLQNEWMANFRGPRGAFRVPFFNGEVMTLDLLKNNRDMEYQKYLEFTASIIGAIWGFDLMEAGLKFFSTTNVLNENQEGRMQFSKDRGLIDMLTNISNVMNKILWYFGMADKYEFFITGLNPVDKQNEMDLRKKKAETYMLLDEIRAMDDLDPLDDGKGQIVLNSVYMQNIQNMQMQQQGAGEDEAGFEGEEGFDDEEGEGAAPGDDDEDLDGAMDDAMDEMGLEKAKNLIKARTMLI